MSKKVISLALVVVMLFSLASVASAALGSGKQMGFTVTASSTTVAPGETVDIIVSVTVPEGDTSWQGGLIPLAYDKDVITEACVSGGSQLFGSSAYSKCVTFPADGYGKIVDTANTCIDPYDLASTITLRNHEKDYGWDSLTVVAITGNGDSYEFGANTVEELLRYEFTVPTNVAAGTEIYVGIPEGAFDDGDNPQGYMYSDYYGMDYWVAYDGEVYDFTDAVVKLTVGAGKIIFHEKAQHNTNLTTADVATLGFVGNFDKNDIGGFTFVEGSTTTLANVTAVGVTLDIAGIGSQTKTTDDLYLKSGSVYNFRAILKDLDLGQYGDAKITATYFVTFLKDGRPTTEYSDPVEFTANGIING